jgi:hypothetical protein
MNPIPEIQQHAEHVQEAWDVMVALRHETSHQIVQLEVALHRLLANTNELEAAKIRQALQSLRLCTHDAAPYDLLDRASTCLSVFAADVAAAAPIVE